MVYESAIIEGHKYRGKFMGEIKNKKIFIPNKPEVNIFYWQGAGDIIDTYTEEKFEMDFITPYIRQEGLIREYTLRGGIVYFFQNGPFKETETLGFQPVLLKGKYKELVDLTLRKMVEQKKEGLELVIAPSHKLVDLINRGICIGRRAEGDSREYLTIGSIDAFLKPYEGA